MIRYSSPLILLTISFVAGPAWLVAQEPPVEHPETKKPVVQNQASENNASQPRQTEVAATPQKVAPKNTPPRETAATQEPPAKVPPEQASPKDAAAKLPPEKEDAAQAAPQKQKREMAVKEKETAKPKTAATEEPKQQEGEQQPAAKKVASKKVASKEVPAQKEAPKKAATPAPKPTLPDAWVNALQWRSIGPANMSGRIPALAVYEKEPSTWWAASASGGLLKTVNNGVTFEHQFDREATVSIGDVQVAPSDPNIVWVGTGEANPRNSVSWGNGVYKSTDGGKTWKNMGLEKTFQIGRMAIHPQDPNIVYVGALGRLWGPNEDRGLYKTTDGGETWNKILYVDDKTGVIDVQMNLKNPDTLLVSTYERQRDGFDGNDPDKKFGPGSSIYLTRDGGKKFQKVTKGLPNCNLGRIGISIYRKDPRQVYLVLESEKIGQVPEKAPYAGIRGEDADIGARLTEVIAKGPAEKAGLKTGDIVFGLNGKTIHSYDQLVKGIDAVREGDKLKLTVSRDRKELQVVLELGKRPEPQQQQQQRRESTPSQSPHDQARTGSKYAASLGGQRENQEQGPEAAQYGGIYHSQDGGVSWKRINSLNPRPMYYSQIRVDPSNNQFIWVLGTSLYLSKDGGVTFSSENTARGIHVDHHSMWIDPNNGNHTILGNDGGIHVTYDRGLNWDHLNHVAIGQFYHVAVGPRRNYRVFGGLQDNGSWGGPQRGPDGGGIINTDWFSVGGGDGFVCAVDPEDADLVYSESQGGATGRYDLRTGARSSMRPRPPRGTQYRFNWKTPFLLSPHNSRVYYSAGNYVFRSPYKGNNLQAISPEITLTDKGSASALAESPAEEGVLYVGTTDGALWATQNGGHTWTNLYGKEQEEQGAGDAAKPAETPAAKTPAEKPAGEQSAPVSARDAEEPVVAQGKSLRELLPGPRWVSSVEASRFKRGRLYVTCDGHRSDDDQPYVFTSEDYGRSWQSLRTNLPDSVGSTRVIREDVRNQNVLYLGTEFSIWVSIDRGQSWTKLNSNLPTVAVHEVAIHPTAGEIVAATHGRSLWVLDVAALRQLSAETIAEPVKLYQPQPAVKWRSQPRRGSAGTRQFAGQNPPDGARIYYSLAKDVGSVIVHVTDIEGKVIREIEGEPKAGLHSVSWDLRQVRPTRGTANSAQQRSRRGGTVSAGKYLVTLIVDDDQFKTVLTVEDDPDAPASR